MRLAVLFELRRAVEAFFTHLTLVRKVLCVNRYDVPFQVARVGALVIAVRALVCFVPLKKLRVLLEFFLVCERLRAMFAFKGQVCTMLGFDVCLQIGLISTSEDTMLTLVRLLPCVGPHVFFELRWVAESFPAFNTNMGEVLAVNCKQVSIEQPLLCSLIVTIFALVHLRLLVPQDQFIGAERAGFSVTPGVLGELVRFVDFVDKLVAFQVVMEADFLVGCKITVCALIFLLNHVIWVIFHMPLQEPPRFKFFPTYVTRVDGQGLSIGANYDSCLKKHKRP